MTDNEIKELLKVVQNKIGTIINELRGKICYDDSDYEIDMNLREDQVQFQDTSKDRYYSVEIRIKKIFEV